MRINLKVVVAMVILVGVIYIAYTTVAQQQYSGEQLQFTVNTGSALVENETGEPVAVTMTSGRVFTVASSESGDDFVSAREGSGRNTRHVAAGELSATSQELRITRGSDVTFDLTGNGSLQVTVTPRSQSEISTIIIVAVVVVAGLLYYISRETKHAWLGMLRRKGLPSQNAEPAAV